MTSGGDLLAMDGEKTSFPGYSGEDCLSFDWKIANQKIAFPPAWTPVLAMTPS